MSIFSRRPATRFSALTVLLSACDPSPPATPVQPKVQVVTGHARPAEGAFEKATFSCCADPGATAAVKAFSDLGASLAADDEGASVAGAGALAAALDGLTTGGDAAPLGAMGPALRSATDITAVRAAYLEVSVPMLALAKTNRGGEATYAIGYCPMKPGRWLQSTAELANPYYGAQMLRCGTFEAME